MFSTSLVPIIGSIKRLALAIGPAVIALVVITVGIEVAVRFFNVSPMILPAPSRVFIVFAERAEMLPFNAWITTVEALTGLLIGILAAIIFSFLVSELYLIRRAFYPLIMATQVVPVIVFAPIILVWFGYGMISKIITAALVCFFPVLVNTTLGLRSLPPEMVELARSLGANDRRIFLKMRLPQAMPYIYASLKPAAVLSMIGAVVAEFIGGNVGLGSMIVESLRFLNLPAMFAATLALIILGFGLFLLVELIEMVTLKWYRKSLRVQK